ncbi:SURF1 family protein [Luteococcus sp. Sow4_B9]|uniref:SURF1 family protein n=1 Tax=Luteococcus sp. Sow4_B9 TaxID=3438792 RepID=UPI003F949856
MTRLKQLLIAVIGCALSVFMIFLGLWQAEVFQSQAQGSAEQRAAGQPRDLESNLQGEVVGDLYGRRVTATGSFLPGKQVLAGTEHPLQVVSAFRTKGGRTLTVVRGTLPQGQSTPPPAPSGPQTVQGVILPTQGKPTVPLPSDAPAGTLSAVRLEQLAQDWPAPLVAGFVTQEADASRAQGLGPKAPDIPDVGGGKERNRGYALQWWAFAIFGFAATWVGVKAAGPKKAE